MTLPFGFPGNGTPIVIEGMHGMGDNIYQVPVIETLLKRKGEVFLRTPWPQIYKHLPKLKLLPIHSKLRTQGKNESKFMRYYTKLHEVPKRYISVRLSYSQAQAAGTPLYRGLCLAGRVHPSNYFLDLKMPVVERENFALIRPATLRTEWMAASRNPRQQYIQRAIDVLNSFGIRTVVVSDIAPPAEIYDEFRPTGATEYYEKGELELEKLMELTSKARLVVSGVGFMAPMGIACRGNVLIVHGGAGGFNGPEMIDAPGASVLKHVLPSRYCRCKNHRHPCDKEIPLPILESAIQQSLEHEQTKVA